jgi:hypothetical protein
VYGWTIGLFGNAGTEYANQCIRREFADGQTYYGH